MCEVFFPRKRVILKKMNGLLSGGLLFCMLFTDFSDVFVFSVCVCMPLRRLVMLKRRAFKGI